MIALCFRQGLRVSELCGLRWDQVNLDEALLTVHRAKGGRDTTHPIPGDELRELRRLKREQDKPLPWVFTTERGGRMATNRFHRMLTRAAESIAFPFPVHPHMLRHAAGYKLVNNRQPVACAFSHSSMSASISSVTLTRMAKVLKAYAQSHGAPLEFWLQSG
jgi:integrase